MPFSDLFKKQQLNRAIKPSTDETFLSPEFQKKRHEAALDFFKAFQEKMDRKSQGAKDGESQ